MLIEDGDVRGLREIIDRTLESDNDCEDKKSFLNELLDRIERFLTENQNTILGLQKSISGYESTIDWKQKELDRLIRELKYNGLSSLKKELNDLLAQAAWYTKRISYARSQISSNNAIIKQYEDSIWKIEDVEIVALENAIRTLQRRSQDLIQKIRYGVGDVAWWIYEQKGVVLTIGKKKDLLAAARKKITDLKWKVKFYNDKNDDLEDQIYNDEI